MYTSIRGGDHVWLDADSPRAAGHRSPVWIWAPNWPQSNSVYGSGYVGDRWTACPHNKLSLSLCVLDWVGAGRGPPIVAAVLAVTGGESTRTLQYNRSGNKSWALFWLFSCFSVNDQLFLTLVRFERVYRINSNYTPRLLYQVIWGTRTLCSTFLFLFLMSINYLALRL